MLEGAIGTPRTDDGYYLVHKLALLKLAFLWPWSARHRRTLRDTYRKRAYIPVGTTGKLLLWATLESCAHRHATLLGEDPRFAGGQGPEIRRRCRAYIRGRQHRISDVPPREKRQYAFAATRRTMTKKLGARTDA